MKPSASLLLFLSLILSTALAARPLEAPIVDVTVYPDRAVVTRSVTLQLVAGLNEIVLGHLSESLLDDSLQVAVQSDDAVAILDLRSANRFGQPDESGRLQPFLEQRKNLQQQIDQVAMNLKLHHQQRGFLEKIETSVTSSPREGTLPSPREWSELMVFFQDSLGDLLPRIQQADAELQELNRQLEAVNREIAQTQAQDRTRTKEVLVRMEAVEAVSEAVLSLSYVVMNASWTPAYNVRVSSAAKSIQLDYQATVRQRTGEDWSQVNLVLSTARPALGGNPPELGRWLVDVRRPILATPPSARAMRVASDSATLMMEAAPSFELAGATVESSLTAVNLRLPVPVSIPADNQPHRVGISSTALDGEFFYTIVPRLSPHAFLQSRVFYTGAAPILAGRTSIFLDGNLVGHSHLSQTEPNETFDLPLGVDEAILVERTLLRRFIEQRGILSKSTRTRLEFATTITNRRSSAEKLVIQDHVPLSQDERIKVELVQLSGGVADPDRPGFYEWTRTVNPRAKLEIPLIFTVEHPEDLDIIGL